MRISKGEIFERVFINEEVNLQIDQEAGSRVKIHVINASFSITVNQLGEGCQTEIYGLENLHGDEQATAETHVTHAVGGGTSNQLIKFVLADNSRGRFIGDLKIAQDAQQTEAHQTNRNLLDILRDNDKRDDEAAVSYTITDIYPQVFSWLELLDINVWIILGLMIAVAGFTMISGLLIIILERTQMIGILKALGARNSTIRHTFLWFAAFIIGRGLLWGNIMGLGIVLIQKYTGVVKLDAQTYYVNEAPMELNLLLIALLNVVTLLVSVFVLVAPSYLVSHIHPARSMHYE